MNLQTYRRQKGKLFEKKMRDSWLKVPGAWRLRLTDNAGEGGRPADDLILTPYGDFLCEYKSTDTLKFNLKMIRENQLAGLTAFPRNAIVFINFDHVKNEVYAIDIRNLLIAMSHLKRESLSYDLFKNGDLNANFIPDMGTFFDLSGYVQTYGAF